MSSLRKVLSWSILCLFLVPAVAVAQTGADKSEVMNARSDGGSLIHRLTGDELFGLLAKEGLVPERLKDTVIRVKMEMITVLFLVADDQESIQAYAGFKSDKANLSKINDWNRSKRYSRAYIDKDGDPVIELDLDLVGGVTPARFVDFVKTVRVSVVQYMKHVFD